MAESSSPDLEFRNGKQSVRLHAEGGTAAGIRQGRLFLEAGRSYDGSAWVKREQGSPGLTIRIHSSQGRPIASIPLALKGSEWQEVPWSFTSPVRDTQAAIEIAVTGKAPCWSISSP